MEDNSESYGQGEDRRQRIITNNVASSPTDKTMLAHDTAALIALVLSSHAQNDALCALMKRPPLPFRQFVFVSQGIFSFELFDCTKNPSVGSTFVTIGEFHRRGNPLGCHHFD